LVADSATKVHKKVPSNSLLSEGQRSFLSFLLPKYELRKHPNRFISTGKRLNNSASHYRNNKNITIFCGGRNNTIVETTKTSQSFLGGLGRSLLLQLHLPLASGTITESAPWTNSFGSRKWKVKKVTLEHTNLNQTMI